MLLARTLRLKETIDSTPMKYNDEIISKVGVSLSWRYSQRHGYRFLMAPWVLFLPNVSVLIRWARMLLVFCFDVTRGRAAARAEGGINGSEETEGRGRKKQEESGEEESEEEEDESEEDEYVTDASLEKARSNRRGLGGNLSGFASNVDRWLAMRSAGLGASSSSYKDGATGSVVLSLSSFFYSRPSWKGLGGRDRKRRWRREKEKREKEEEEEKEREKEKGKGEVNQKKEVAGKKITQ